MNINEQDDIGKVPYLIQLQDIQLRHWYFYVKTC